MAEYKVDEILKNTIIESKLITQDEKRKLLSRLREEKLINTRKRKIMKMRFRIKIRPTHK